MGGKIKETRSFSMMITDVDPMKDTIIHESYHGGA